MEIGRTLYCLNGEKVKVVAFDSQSIFVEYQGRTYSRPVSAIGKTLFSSKKAAQKEYNFIKERDLNQRGFYRIIHIGSSFITYIDAFGVKRTTSANAKQKNGYVEVEQPEKGYKEIYIQEDGYDNSTSLFACSAGKFGG